MLDTNAMESSLAEDPAFLRLTPNERNEKPELQDVESLQLFTTRTGRTLVCLITDPAVYRQSRVEEVV